MKGRMGWILRVGLLLFAIAVVIYRARERKASMGFVLGVTSSTCSVEQMQSLSPPLLIRLLHGGDVQFSFADTVSHEEAHKALALMNRTRINGLLLLDGDDSLTVENMAAFLNEVHSAMPTWKIVLVTPKTRPACEHLIKMSSGPAA